MAVEDDVLGLLKLVLFRPDVPAGERLADALRVLAKFRTEQLEEELAAALGDHVRDGPFAGMRFPLGFREGCYLPKLLGSYERELEPIVSTWPERGYRTVINAGCAEGYYAVGLARLMPEVQVYAYDSDPRAQERCEELAGLNGVGDRVRVSGSVDASSFEGHDGPTLVVCDIEGAEGDVLDPTVSPALAGMDILVEVHDVFVEGVGELVRGRFSGSHAIRTVWSGAGVTHAVVSETIGTDQLDQLLTAWDGRVEGVWWEWMEAR